MALKTILSDAMFNLDSISEVNIHSTLLVKNNKLICDTRYLQFIQRFINGDGRFEILDTIKKTFVVLDEIIHAYAHYKLKKSELYEDISYNVQELINRKTSVIDGLVKLGKFKRYEQDVTFKINLKCCVKLWDKIINKCECLQ
jgi:hypothetical protein